MDSVAVLMFFGLDPQNLLPPPGSVKFLWTGRGIYSDRSRPGGDPRKASRPQSFWSGMGLGVVVKFSIVIIHHLL